MPIFDVSKLHPNLKSMIDWIQKINEDATSAFLEQKNLGDVELDDLDKKIEFGNELWIKRKNMKGYLTEKEIYILVLRSRFTARFLSDYLRKNLAPLPSDIKFKWISDDQVNAEWNIIPNAAEDKVILFLHGGAWLQGSTDESRGTSILLGKSARMNVFSVNYRLAPEHPFPTGLQDCVNAYRWLLDKDYKPENIIISGESAGANLTLCSLLKIRDDRLPTPRGACCFSPATDLSFNFGSIYENASSDLLVRQGMLWWCNFNYTTEDNFKNPLVSPYYGNFKDIPPILIQVSKSEMLYDDSRLFYEKSKNEYLNVTLQSWNNMPHVFQIFGLPESKEAINKFKNFVESLFRQI